MSKPKTNYSAGHAELHSKDLFQTPTYAFEMIAPFLSGFDAAWDPACGEGYLIRAAKQQGFLTIHGDLQLGNDFFSRDSPPPSFNRTLVQVTNTPFSKKFDWIEHSLQIGIPFAILVPSDVLFTKKFSQWLRRGHDLRMVMPDNGHRFRFKTPLTLPNDPAQAWINSSPQMHTSWLTYKLETVTDPILRMETEFKPTAPLAEKDYLCPPQFELATRLIAEEKRKKEEAEAKKARKAA